MGHTSSPGPYQFHISVHPHLRGAYGLGCVSLVYQDRFIPTYVGHTGSIVCSLVWDSVHPHLRGAYTGVTLAPLTTFGSSPPTWGIQNGSDLNGPTPRFIPTYVGHTSQSRVNIAAYPVHPHIRGAYRPAPGAVTQICGSSPHTWGIQNLTKTFRDTLRFIPTYVGHTLVNGIPSPPWPVHPHIRGAYAGSYTNGQKACGSSPHTWGILSSVFCFVGSSRFIPTYVGHTSEPPLALSFGPVHPHIRGAYAR